MLLALRARRLEVLDVALDQCLALVGDRAGDDGDSAGAFIAAWIFSFGSEGDSHMVLNMALYCAMKPGNPSIACG